MWTLATETENEINGRHKEINYFDEVLTDESGGCSSDGGTDVLTEDSRKMSSQSEEIQKEYNLEVKQASTESKLQSLKDNVTRTNQFLIELKALSESCQEYIPAIEYETDENGELHKERQVFVRRIVQLGAELQDAKDTVLAICKDRMSSRQWKILLDITGPNYKQNYDDDEFIINMMSSCNLDPSVRFFGIEWERVFGRCFSLSLNVKIFGQQVMNSFEESYCSSNSSTVDLILINTLLKDFSTLESDITSHAEAVLQGRLSKSQNRLIKREQLKNCAPLSRTINNDDKRKKSSKSPNLTKSRSFRRFGPVVTPASVAGRKQSGQLYKYRKNKTTNFDKLLGSELDQTSTPVNSVSRTSDEVSFHNNGSIAQMTTNNGGDNGASNNIQEPYSQEMKEVSHPRNDMSKGVGNVVDSEEPGEYILPKKKNSIFQNVSSMFKNMR